MTLKDHLSRKRLAEHKVMSERSRNMDQVERTIPGCSRSSCHCRDRGFLSAWCGGA